jgi:hypothetical protein
MQNHLTRPTGSLSKPKANVVSSSQKNEGKGKVPEKALWKGKNQKSKKLQEEGIAEIKEDSTRGRIWQTGPRML